MDREAWHTAAVHHAAHDGRVLRVLGGAGLTGGADHHKAIRAVGDVPVAQLLDLFKVDAPIGMERRNQRHIAALEHAITSFVYFARRNRDAGY